MLLSRKQRIILLCAGGAALLLLVGLIILIESSRTESPAESAASPSPSASPAFVRAPTPSATPQPSATPTYRLPLVPFSETASPSAEPSAPPALQDESSPSPYVYAPSEIRDGRYDARVRDFLTVGLSDGAPAALLLIRLAPPDLYVLSIPCEALPPGYESSYIPNAKPVSDKNTVKSASALLAEAVACLCGYRAMHWVTVDLSCMPAMIESVPPLSGGGITFDSETFCTLMNTTGRQRAYGMGALGVSVARLFSTVSPWELPALQRATKGKITSELNLWELIGLAAAARGIERTQIYLLPVDEADGAICCNRAETEKLFGKIFK